MKPEALQILVIYAKNNMKKNNLRGLSLVEILIVITIFAVIGLLSTRSVFLTIRGAKKSDSLVRVRENVNYSLAVIERQLRSAETIDCPNALTTQIDYVTLEGLDSSFTCQSIGSGGYIASDSARLTSEDISVTNCSFSCSQQDINNPPVVDVLIEAEDSESQTVEKGTVSIQTQIILRNY